MLNKFFKIKIIYNNRNKIINKEDNFFFNRNYKYFRINFITAALFKT